MNWELWICKSPNQIKYWCFMLALPNMPKELRFKSQVEIRNIHFSVSRDRRISKAVVAFRFLWVKPWQWALLSEQNCWAFVWSFYQVWLGKKKQPFFVVKKNSNTSAFLYSLQHHFWPAFDSLTARNKSVFGVHLLPSWNSEIGGSQVCAADRPRASERYLSCEIQPSTPSSARRPPRCSSQGGRFVWNDILGIRRIAEEQEMCSWASHTHWNEKFRRNPAGEKLSVFYLSSSLVQMNLFSYD